ncbi:MAG TPA: NAD-binding protein, partial [Candidatus Hydrogenedentes bacterium]|nr:NAD-binding protein [Candidatus Hydrogenedentota bacterium]
MNIFILGGGRVGYHLALLLSEEVYEVTVIENDPERQEYIDQMLNAQVILGDGSSALFLQSLDVGEADLFVACTGHDETNLLAAAAAKGLGA